MAYATIENGIVSNAVEASATFAKAQGWIELSAGAGIGWRYEGGKFLPPVAPMTPPTETFNPISDRQLFQGLASDPWNVITTQEALDAVKTGEIPAVMQAVIDQMPPEAQFAASMIISGGTQFERFNPMVETFAASRDWPVAQTNKFWHFCESL